MHSIVAKLLGKAFLLQQQNFLLSHGTFVLPDILTLLTSAWHMRLLSMIGQYFHFRLLREQAPALRKNFGNPCRGGYDPPARKRSNFAGASSRPTVILGGPCRDLRPQQSMDV